MKYFIAMTNPTGRTVYLRRIFPIATWAYDQEDATQYHELFASHLIAELEKSQFPPVDTFKAVRVK